MGIVIRDILAVLPGEVWAPRVCSVYIEGGSIVAIDQQPADFQVDKTIHGCGKLLIPGLVNTHTHAYMSVFRNSADDLPFQEWLFQRIMPIEDQLTPEDAYWATLLSAM